MGFFTVAFYQPIYNLLVWLYQVLPGGDIGFSIIVITVLVKGALFPLTFRMLRSQKQMQELQPKIKEIREKYKDDKEKLAAEMMQVYKENKVNPFASCLPLLIQLPIFIAIYRVLRDGLGAVDDTLLYSFVSNPGELDAMFFGVINLGAIFIPFGIVAAILQFIQAKQTLARKVDKAADKSSGAMDEKMAANMGKMMLYFMPAFTLMLSFSLPAGVMLYWLTTTGLTIILYHVFLGDKKKGV